jgi:hypothetical protein
MTADEDLLGRIKALVEEEHELAGREDSVARRREIEVQLDQCWDLLRQRRARREFGEDAGAAELRPSSEVESYLQ